MDQRAEEHAAIDNERRAFERRQAAFFTLAGHSTPQGNGATTASDLAEWEAANADWKAANAEIERIASEIRTGRRR
ncbi:hypothetical protein [Oleiagrimonas sp.]|jgi:hypothetical protein|uniref:hypothetical protein n=1 Tax=Oleiagrimonas sp. TaxID=2010330 RepID=UPI002618CCEA|nr:hypothetical protein [Oleiagrimonas sp.]MDA3913121.1 hypothetical protein [Oleiagrimonas sp.]